MSQRSSCGSGSGNVAGEIKKLYTELALNPHKDFGWGRGKENARALGYSAAWLDRLPGEVWASAAAVGNVFSIGETGAGNAVADFGCGAGADLCVAALLAGEKGELYGVEMTPAMAEKAQRNLAPRKECVLKEIRRVLKPRGRLLLADIVREKAEGVGQCGQSWANCVSGTLEPEHLLALMKKAGFENAALKEFTGYRTSPTTVGALFYAEKA